MAMTNASRMGKFNPLRLIKEEWREDAQQELVKLEGRNTTVQFPDSINVLHGTKSPELFLIWLIIFCEQVIQKKNVTHELKRKIFSGIVLSYALTVF